MTILFYNYSNEYEFYILNIYKSILKNTDNIKKMFIRKIFN